MADTEPSPGTAWISPAEPNVLALAGVVVDEQSIAAIDAMTDAELAEIEAVNMHSVQSIDYAVTDLLWRLVRIHGDRIRLVVEYAEDPVKSAIDEAGLSDFVTLVDL